MNKALRIFLYLTFPPYLAFKVLFWIDKQLNS